MTTMDELKEQLAAVMFEVIAGDSAWHWADADEETKHDWRGGAGLVIERLFAEWIKAADSSSDEALDMGHGPDCGHCAKARLIALRAQFARAVLAEHEG